MRQRVRWRRSPLDRPKGTTAACPRCDRSACRIATLRLARARSFAVAAFNFSYGVNLGTLVRSAEAAGAEAVWIIGRDFYYRPSTKGTDWWLPIVTIDSPAACLELAEEEGLRDCRIAAGSRGAADLGGRMAPNVP